MADGINGDEEVHLITESCMRSMPYCDLIQRAVTVIPPYVNWY